MESYGKPMPVNRHDSPVGYLAAGITAASSFVDLRDRTGITQVVFDPIIDPEAHSAAQAIRNEFVLNVSGKVRERGEGLTNPNLLTGEIELATDELEILNVARTPPFSVEDDIETAEDVRLMQYRYVDLRRPKMQKMLQDSAQSNALAARRYMDEQGFLEIETPILMNSTPEGARDFLVPSRHNPGKFYALATVTAAVQATINDEWYRSLFPNSRVVSVTKIPAQIGFLN